MMKKNIYALISWIVVAWICKVFLFSLPYKFTTHPDTVHIFSVIGEWMKGILGDGVGSLFASYGSYAVGTVEFITSIILLLPAILWIASRLGFAQSYDRSRYHRIGGLMASAVMAGAAFFHLFTPLGIEVLHEGKSDGGSLFYAAVSILVLGLVLFFINLNTRNV